MALNSEFNYLSLDSTEGFEDLGITNDDWIIYQKFFLPNSRIKKYFKDSKKVHKIIRNALIFKH